MCWWVGEERGRGREGGRVGTLGGVKGGGMGTKVGGLLLMNMSYVHSDVQGLGLVEPRCVWRKRWPISRWHRKVLDHGGRFKIMAAPTNIVEWDGKGELLAVSVYMFGMTFR